MREIVTFHRGRGAGDADRLNYGVIVEALASSAKVAAARSTRRGSGEREELASARELIEPHGRELIPADGGGGLTPNCRRLRRGCGGAQKMRR